MITLRHWVRNRNLRKDIGEHCKATSLTRIWTPMT